MSGLYQAALCVPICVAHMSAGYEQAGVNCWCFACFGACEVVWLSEKPHLNCTMADNRDLIMRLFIGAASLWTGCSLFLWINQLGSIWAHWDPVFTEVFNLHKLSPIQTVNCKAVEQCCTIWTMLTLSGLMLTCYPVVHQHTKGESAVQKGYF